MTEKEKMMAGEAYNANAPELVAERLKAKQLCHKYNQTEPAEAARRADLLRQLIGTLSGETIIEQPFWCDYGCNITLGNRFYANHGLTILDGACVTIGHDVFIGPHCGLYTATHPLDPHRRNLGEESAHPIHIGNNVWLGGNVTVLPGVTIGHGSVIGAGSVVTHNIPSGVVAAGNPCRIIRKIEE